MFKLCIVCLFAVPRGEGREPVLLFVAGHAFVLRIRRQYLSWFASSSRGRRPFAQKRRCSTTNSATAHCHRLHSAMGECGYYERSIGIGIWMFHLYFSLNSRRHNRKWQRRHRGRIHQWPQLVSPPQRIMISRTRTTRLTNVPVQILVAIQVWAASQALVATLVSTVPPRTSVVTQTWTAMPAMAPTIVHDHHLISSMSHQNHILVQLDAVVPLWMYEIHLDSRHWAHVAELVEPSSHADEFHDKDNKNNSYGVLLGYFLPNYFIPKDNFHRSQITISIYLISNMFFTIEYSIRISCA